MCRFTGGRREWGMNMMNERSVSKHSGSSYFV